MQATQSTSQAGERTQQFTATLKFDSRKKAVEAQQVIEVLERSLPVKFFTRSGSGKKSVQFYCDGPETAKVVRARYFHNADITWATTPAEREAVEQESLPEIEILPPSPITAKDNVQNALAELEQLWEALPHDAQLCAMVSGKIGMMRSSLRAALKKL